MNTVSSEEAAGIREKTSRSNVILRVQDSSSQSPLDIDVEAAAHSVETRCCHKLDNMRAVFGVTKHKAPVGRATSKRLSLVCDTESALRLASGPRRKTRRGKKEIKYKPRN